MRCLTQLFSAAAWWLAVVAVAGAQSAAPVASGNHTLASAMEALQWHVSIVARIRHQSRLGEHALMGSGNYWQRGTGEKQVSKWEMQTQVAGKTASYAQVFDGDYLWTDRRLPSGREVRRLDVKLLQSRLGTQTLQHEEGAAHSVELARGHGGLSQMLADLMQRYDFDPPRQTQLNGLAVYALLGRWRGEELAALGVEVEEQGGEEASPWPTQLPHHVLVLLGREKLFPYVIEFRSSSDAYLLSTVAGLRPTRDPLVRYEVFGVQFAQAIDPSLFQYKPGDVQWTDETMLVVERLREERENVALKLADRNVAAESR